jgi:CHRD domain-containing protein
MYAIGDRPNPALPVAFVKVQNQAQTIVNTFQFLFYKTPHNDDIGSIQRRVCCSDFSNKEELPRLFSVVNDIYRNDVYGIFMSRIWLLPIIVVLAGIILASAALVSLNSIRAQEGEIFSSNLSGKDEVPPTSSNAVGWAKFQTNDNGTQISYWLNITGLNKITGSHIHTAGPGKNGDVVATLSGQESTRDNNATLALRGNITKDNLEGPLKGKDISELESLMSDGNVYVNVHTEEFHDGAIRGQIASGLPTIVNSSSSGSPESNSTNSSQG